MGGWVGSDPQKMMLSDPRGGRRPTGGSVKAAQYKDKSVLTYGITGNEPGFGMKNAFMTPQQIAKRDKLSYEEANDTRGGMSGAAGYDRMTQSEKETYKVQNMKIAATKTDDYSTWGKGIVKAADEAHSKGLLSVQDEKDKLVIDARDASRYDYEVTAPEQARKAEILRTKRLLEKQMSQFTYGDKQYGGARSEPRLPGSGNSGFKYRRASKGGSSIRKASWSGPKNPMDNWSTTPRPWNSSVSEVQAYQLGKDGWTPEQIKESGTQFVPKNLSTVTALPGVAPLGVSGGALYSGEGQWTPQGEQMASSSSVMNRFTRDANFGTASGGGLGG